MLATAAATPSLDGGPPLVVVLEGLNDPENIGAVFRNAAAFGAGAVLVDPTCGDPYYRRAVRVSVGHALHLPWARLDPWPGSLAEVRAAGFVLCALAPHPSRGPDGGAERVDLPVLAARRRPVAVLVGAEGPGLSEAALDAADVVVAVPWRPASTRSTWPPRSRWCSPVSRAAEPRSRPSGGPIRAVYRWCDPTPPTTEHA